MVYYIYGGVSIRAAFTIHTHIHRAEAFARKEDARAWEAELARHAETPEQCRARLHAHALAFKEKKCVRGCFSWMCCYVSCPGR